MLASRRGNEEFGAKALCYMHRLSWAYIYYLSVTGEEFHGKQYLHAVC